MRPATHGVFFGTFEALLCPSCHEAYRVYMIGARVAAALNAAGLRAGLMREDGRVWWPK